MRRAIGSVSEIGPMNDQIVNPTILNTVNSRYKTSNIKNSKGLIFVKKTLLGLLSQIDNQASPLLKTVLVNTIPEKQRVNPERLFDTGT